MSTVLCDLGAWTAYASRAPLSPVPKDEAEQALQNATCTKVEVDRVRNQWWFTEMHDYAKILSGLPPSAQLPVHLLSAEGSRHGRTFSVSPHRIPLHLPAGPLQSIQDPYGDEPIYVVGPSLYVLLRAPLLNDIALARMVSDICGNYVLRVDQNHELACRPNPITSVAKLKGDLHKLSAERGTTRILSILDFSASGAASPMETAVALMMCAPRPLGGRGFPVPHLNEPIPLEPDERKLIGRSAMKLDFFWPEARVAVEYDSAQFHGNESQDELDKLRREVASSRGIELMSLTRSVLRDPVRLDLFMERAAQRLDIGFDWSDRYLPARRSLRSQVLSEHLVW